MVHKIVTKRLVVEPSIKSRSMKDPFPMALPFHLSLLAVDTLELDVAR